MLHLRSSLSLSLGALILGLASFATIAPLRETAVRTLLFGGPLLRVVAPRSGGVVAQGGIPVLVVFPHPDAILGVSLRCLLNGEDVTERLRTSSNGASGTLWSRRPGPHLLRVEILGRTWWGEGLYPDRVEVPFQVRRNSSIDRA
ncbi:MAG: hypothetical protein ACE5IL_04265 [Myxococcota bacterium]